MKHIFLFILLAASLTVCGQQQQPVLVIHGGAGNMIDVKGNVQKKNLTAEEEKAYKDKLAEALQAGYKILNDGGSSLEAIEKTITILEDSPLFNAGKGAVLTEEGKAELDASIMTGHDLKAGAVAGVTTVKNPIKAARKVMEKTPHVMLAGKGADEFAKSAGLELVDPDYFVTPERKQQLLKIRQRVEEKKNEKSGSATALPFEKFGTVGAVAIDKKGNLAAGTSTGGMMMKKFGRVGDSPIIGAGTYASNESCAVSCTGHGEYFIRNAVAYDVSALMKYKNLTLQQAADQVVMEKLKQQGGEGGLIAVDKNGNFTMSFNTTGMYRGYIKEEGKPNVFIYREE